MRPPGRPTAETGRTEARILRAAERLFAERGFAGTSLRDLAAEAGANTSSVGYHFGSKAALFDRVVRRALVSVGAELMGRLEEVEATKATPADGPAVEELVDALVSPFLEPPPGGLGGRDRARLFLRFLAGETGAGFDVGDVARVEERFLRPLSETLPHLPADGLRWRLRAAIWVAAFRGSVARPGGPPAIAQGVGRST